MNPNDGDNRNAREATFDKLLEVAELVAPELARQMRVGLFHPRKDLDTVKLRLMVAVSKIS